jgi:hypothetical protein
MIPVPPLSVQTQLAVGFALFVPVVLSLWKMLVPELMTTSTYAMVTALVIGIAAVTLKSVQGAQPTGSLGQLLYDTEHPTPRTRS